MKRVLVPLSLLALLSCAAPSTTTKVAPYAASAPQVVAANKVVPWGLAFLPDGSALFTERVTRSIWAVAPGHAARRIYTVNEARANGEGGLLGIAVGPTYSRDGRVYLYYTTGTDNRIAFIRRGSAARPTPIVTGIPAAGNHNGGRIVFGPDGFLYAGTGDAGNTANAQNASSLGGKVLRVTTSGAAAPGNPNSSRVWSLGHRNVQGLVFDRNRNLWATEFGQNTYDEVNLIVAGGNYGWPTVEGKGNDSRFRNPAWTWSPSEASPSGIGIRGDSLYVAALRGGRIWRLRFSGTTISSATSMFQGSFGRLRTVMQNPRDGSVWITTSNRDGRGSPAPSDDRVLRFSRFP
ncbi:MAG: PQQ-dependent sugar dehydrogenase [Frankiaceae bacterium]|nr:PQQ-dependent sugar dehydrogenase [Frankiaceae bacterium]